MTCILWLKLDNCLIILNSVDYNMLHSPLASDRTRWEIMSRWTNDQPNLNRAFHAFVLLYHKSKALRLVDFF